MLRTTPPPEGIGVLENFFVRGSNLTNVFGSMPDSLNQTVPSGVTAIPYGLAPAPPGEGTPRLFASRIEIGRAGRARSRCRRSSRLGRRQAGAVERRRVRGIPRSSCFRIALAACAAEFAEVRRSLCGHHDPVGLGFLRRNLSEPHLTATWIEAPDEVGLLEREPKATALIEDGRMRIAGPRIRRGYSFTLPVFGSSFPTYPFESP